MVERGQLKFGDATIEYEVHRSQRRRKTVQITMDGRRVLVAAPVDAPVARLEAIIHKRSPWILRQAPDSLIAHPRKRFVSGETLPYLGRNVRLVVETADVPAPEARFDHWSFRIAAPAHLEETKRYEEIIRVVVQWYRKRASRRLPHTVELWRKRMGLTGSPEVLIRDQRQRWGSCAPDGTLRFNWRVIMLTPALIDYVVIHELSHLRVNDHSRDFWGLISKTMPDAQFRRRRLREAGKLLPM